MPTDPASLSIVHHPAPVLRQKAAEIDEVTDEIRAIVARMIQLMIEAPGIGLAAPQVGLSLRMFVCHVPPDEDETPSEEPRDWTDSPMVAINPIMSDPSKGLVGYEEGCLSLPHITGEVKRPERITMTALNENGEEFTMPATGLLARCWQHEYDHLDGVLILDRMTAGSRLKNRRAVKELERGIL